MADSNNSDSAAGSPTVPSSSALDLSPKSLNVVDSAEDWSVDQVVDFVRGVEGCEEYAEVNNYFILATTHFTRTWADRNRAEWDSLRRLVTPLPQGAFLFSRGFKSGVPSASPSLALSLPPSALRRRRPRHRTPHFSCDSDPRVGIADFPLGQSRGRERSLFGKKELSPNESMGNSLSGVTRPPDRDPSVFFDISEGEE